MSCSVACKTTYGKTMHLLGFGIDELENERPHDVFAVQGGPRVPSSHL
jgi:hypothetical protein